MSLYIAIARADNRTKGVAIATQISVFIKFLISVGFGTHPAFWQTPPLRGLRVNHYENSFVEWVLVPTLSETDPSV